VGESHFCKVRAWDREHDRAENSFVSHGLQILILGRAGSDMDESEMKERRPIRPPPLENSTSGYYLPAAAAAAAGIMPAIFMPSIRVRTASRLAPVSVQAST
jgi:hypothetical protein